MPITATGIGSGLDVESLVSQLVLADVQPAENRLNSSEAKYQAELTAYGSLKGALAGFQSSVASSAASSQYVGKTASTSLSDIVTATAEQSAPEGSYALEVQSLAEAQSLASSGYAATTSTVGTGTLTITLGTVTYDANSGSVTGFAAKADVTPVTITIDSSNNTLSGVKDAINASDANVVASIVNDGSGYRLVLQGQDTGAENAVTITVNDTGDGDSTDAAGLSNLAFDETTSNVTQTNAAANSHLQLTGLLLPLLPRPCLPQLKV